MNSDLAKTSLVVMGYSLRTDKWRYTTWLLWDQLKRCPVWLYPPFGEELFDHSQDKNTADFDVYESANLANDEKTASIRWVLFNALKALVEGDSEGKLEGGRQLGITGLAKRGINSWITQGYNRLPAEIEHLLTKSGLLPPQFNVHNLHRSANRRNAAAIQFLPQCTSIDDSNTLTHEGEVRLGENIEVAFMNKSGILTPDLRGNVSRDRRDLHWMKYKVVDIIPRWTLRGEKGAALVLASNSKYLLGNLHVPSIIWPEGAHQKLINWRRM